MFVELIMLTMIFFQLKRVKILKAVRKLWLILWAGKSKQPKTYPFFLLSPTRSLTLLYAPVEAINKI